MKHLKLSISLLSVFIFAFAFVAAAQAQGTIGLNGVCDLAAPNCLPDYTCVDAVNADGDNDPTVCNQGLGCDPLTDTLCKGDLSKRCDQNNDCSDYYTGLVPYQVNEIVCDGTGSQRQCVPKLELRTIGTYCDSAEHCDTASVNFDLTCQKDSNICVGAVSGIDCSDAVPNQDSDLVIPATFVNVSRQYRCDDNLVCALEDDGTGECKLEMGTKFGEDLGLGGSTDDIRDQIRQVINIALGFLGVAGVIVIIYGGAIWLTAAGDDEKVGKAKKSIVAGLIGLVIIGIAWTIVSYVLSIATDLAG